ncbi:MAG: Zn-finger containing protein [Clostridiaceae bacterium BRH_c20a]|nr:MAG: Zn-finger containing protein [Clostridiaceae bacterium BRH_c20a]
MNWLRKFMMDRYGVDQFSMALLILSVLLALIAQIIRLPLLAFISYIPLGLCIYRMLSRNIAKRSMENYKFFMLISPLYSWFKKTQSGIKTLKTHRYFKCPNCRSTLRLPKGKGKIIINCPKCKTKFEKET